MNINWMNELIWVARIAAATLCGACIGYERENNLKTARRRLLARWHPDVCNDPQASERFKKVQTVYTFLHKELIYKQAKAKTA